MLNREEIEQLPAGEQLDKLIGETFGFRQQYSQYGRGGHLFWRDYSVRLQYAWHVVAAMKSRGWSFHLVDEQHDGDEARWAAKFAKSGSSRFSTATARTPELAICHAGLCAAFEDAPAPTPPANS